MSRGSRAWLFLAGWAAAFAWHSTISADSPQWWQAGLSLAFALLCLAAARPKPTPAAPTEPEMDRAHAFAQGLASDRELLAPLDDAAKGYRAQLITDGWSLEAAEHMALAFYTTQLAMLTNTAGGADA